MNYDPVMQLDLKELDDFTTLPIHKFGPNFGPHEVIWPVRKIS